jgi:hypothetical protein
LRQAWLRSSLAALAIALAIVAVALFGREVTYRKAEVLAGYEQAGATAFVAELNGLAENKIVVLADAIRSAGAVHSVDVSYNGVRLGLVADVFSLVFQNTQQKEYLGARTTVLGVGPTFDPVRDYYVDFHDLNPKAPQTAFGIPLFAASGAFRTPSPHEIVVPTSVADYVGVRPGAEATVDLMYTGVTPAIVRRFEGLRMIGTFDAVGPDQARFEPFWRLAAQDEEVLTVRRPDAAEGVTTTLPVVLNQEIVREFLAYVRTELGARGTVANDPLTPDRLVIRAGAIDGVPAAEAAVKRVLEQQSLVESCKGATSASFCLRLPERNNFRAAQREQSKVGAGGAFFLSLLLALIAVGTAGLQVQTVLARWRDFGVFQAVGFSPGQILRFYAIELGAVLAGSIAVAAVVVLVLRSAGGDLLSSFGLAAAVAVVAASLAALPVVLWPLSRPPAELLRLSA